MAQNTLTSYELRILKLALPILKKLIEPSKPKSGKTQFTSLVFGSHKNENVSQTKAPVELYADGSYSVQTKVGGWGVLLLKGNRRKEINGFVPLGQSASRMELVAILEGLKALKTTCNVIVHSDSRYALGAMTGNKVNANSELVKALKEESLKHSVEWIWVKGHASNAGNIVADKLASQGRKLGENSKVFLPKKERKAHRKQQVKKKQSNIPSSRTNLSKTQQQVSASKLVVEKRKRKLELANLKAITNDTPFTTS